MKTITAVRVVDRVQDQADVTGSLVDGATLVWDTTAKAFVYTTIQSVVEAGEVDPAKIAPGTAAINIGGIAAIADYIDGGLY